MDQLNQVAQNIVKILSDWKDENDKYKAHIDKLQTSLDVQAASLQNIVNSNLASQSNATKTVEKSSGKRSLPRSSNEAAASPPKRIKNNDGEPVASCKLQVYHFLTVQNFRLLDVLFLLASKNTADENTNAAKSATAKRTPKPLVMISPLAIKKEKGKHSFVCVWFSVWSFLTELTSTIFVAISCTDDTKFVVNSRTVGKLTVSSKSGELQKNSLDTSVTIARTTRFLRRKSQVSEQPLAIVMVKKTVRAAPSVAQALQASTSSASSNASQATNKGKITFVIHTILYECLFDFLICFDNFQFEENESFSTGAPVTSTPNVIGMAKKTTAKDVATKANKKPGKVLKPSSVQNANRVMTRRASKM